MHSDFLLKDALARQLFDAVKDLPIIDWHNHLSISDLSSDKQFADISELWVVSDPYKHRAMRICGVPERFITGECTPYERFKAWSWTLPQLVGNPLYDWSRLELQRVFGIEKALAPDSAEIIWKTANERLAEPGFSARGLLERRAQGLQDRDFLPSAIRDALSERLTLKNTETTRAGWHRGHGSLQALHRQCKCQHGAKGK